MTDPYLAEYIRDLRATGKHADNILDTYTDLLARLDPPLHLVASRSLPAP
ncbi:hypothetical protein [Micromonospora sp. DPT]